MEKLNEKFFLYSFCFALIIISIIPNLFKSLFVHHSGKFEAVGIGFALILIIAIYKKWQHTRLLFNIIFIGTLLVEIIIISMSIEPYLLHYAFLMLAQIGLLLIFNFSNIIKNRIHRFSV